MKKEEEYFTVIFMGNVKKLEGNPFWFESDFGTSISIAAGHALEELDELKDEIADLKKANQILHELLSNRDAEIRRPACTCGGDPLQPASDHDISCPSALASEERS